MASKRIEKLRAVLLEIGNVIGAPTMSYAPAIERDELLNRMKKVSDLVIAGLANEMSSWIKIDWVKCPICDEPDMQKETDKDGNSLIFCANHDCASNGGDSNVGGKEAIRTLARAMKKILPPKLLQEVIDCGDPLTAFLRDGFGVSESLTDND